MTERARSEDEDDNPCLSTEALAKAEANRPTPAKGTWLRFSYQLRKAASGLWKVTIIPRSSPTRGTVRERRRMGRDRLRAGYHSLGSKWDRRGMRRHDRHAPWPAR